MDWKILAALVCLFSAIGVPYSAQAYGSYSNDQLNTTNTEQNITFGFGTESPQESYTEQNFHTEEPLYGVGWVAQTFTVGNRGDNRAFDITGVSIRGYREGSPTDLNVSIRNINGTGYPKGADLCFGRIDPSGISTSAGYFNISITGCSLNASTQYAIIFRATGSVMNWIRYYVDKEVSTYTGGEWFTSADSGASWGITYSGDVPFIVYGRPLSYSEIVYITIPRMANITGAEWVSTGYTYDYLSYQENYTTFSYYNWTNIHRAYDGIWITNIAQCLEYECGYYANYTITSNATGAFWQFNWWWAGLSEMENISIPSACLVTSPLKLFVNASEDPIGGPGSYGMHRSCMNSTNDWITVTSSTVWGEFVEEAIWWNISDYPENVTIDTGNNGENEYVNDTIFKTSVTIDLNVTAINNYLHDTCTADWQTGSCDVPFNVSSNISGILGISSISIIGEYFYGYFNIEIYDEMTGDLYNTSDMTLTALCVNDTETTTITNHTTTGVWIVCDLVHLKLEISNGSISHWRTLQPDGGYETTVSFYMINTTNTQVEQDWTIYDISGEFTNGTIRVRKVVPDEGVQTMIEHDIDAESKVILFLIQDEEYTLIAISADGTDVRTIGGYITDTGTSKILTISEVKFNPALNLIMNSVFYSVEQSVTGSYIRFYYNDTLDQTLNVSVEVINASNITQTLYSTSGTAATAIFTYNAVDVNSTYIAKMTITHAAFGIINMRKTIDFGYGSSVHLVGLGGLGAARWEPAFAMAVVIFTILLFSTRNAAAGLGIGTMEMLMFYNWGWFKTMPALGPGMLVLMVAMTVLVFLAQRRGS